MKLLTYSVAICWLFALTPAAISAGDADPETVYIIFSVKRGREHEFQKVNSEAWAAYQRLGMVFNEPHVSVEGTDNDGQPYFVDIMTWRNHSIPDHVPPEIDALWAKMRDLCEKRAGRDGIDFTEVKLRSGQPH
jgi:hypothetical protein